MKKIISALALCVIPLAANAQSTQAFTERDVPRIIDAGMNNAVRFERDYKGQAFSGHMAFDKASRPLLSVGDYEIAFGSRHEAVVCTLNSIVPATDKPMLAMIADWTPGQKALVTGTISGVSAFGELHLEKCSITQERGLLGTRP
jgi:hypothetical protein